MHAKLDVHPTVVLPGNPHPICSGSWCRLYLLALLLLILLLLCSISLLGMLTLAATIFYNSWCDSRQAHSARVVLIVRIKRAETLRSSARALPRPPARDAIVRRAAGLFLDNQCIDCLCYLPSLYCLDSLFNFLASSTTIAWRSKTLIPFHRF